MVAGTDFDADAGQRPTPLAGLRDLETLGLRLTRVTDLYAAGQNDFVAQPDLSFTEVRDLTPLSR